MIRIRISVLKLQNYNEVDREREDGGGERRKKRRKEGRKEKKGLKNNLWEHARI